MNNSIKKAIFISLAVYSFIAGFGCSMLNRIAKTLPSVESLEAYSSLVSRIFDRKDRLFHEFYEERRVTVPLENIPEYVIKGTIAVEDQRFYSHCGIDMFGIVRAVLFNIHHGRVIQGASTITQQEARNLFLTLDKRMLRKIKEAILAIHIERAYSKDEILELYFNQIYFGNGAYGIETAAQRYFGKHASQLNLPECALLIGIPKSTAKYNPKIHPENAKKRRDLILDIMALKGIITEESAIKAKEIPIKVAEKPSFQGIAPYFVEEIKEWVTSRFGPDILYRGGISIYTTIDRDIQQIAETTAREGLDELDQRFNAHDTLNPLQIALFAMNPKNGEIIAEVGGRNFNKSTFNRVRQGIRQAGSAFKPFTWLAAIEAGSTTCSIVMDDSITIDDWGRVYSPTNYDDKFLGPLTLRKGLALSRNLVAVRLIMHVGPEKVVGYARRMGITTSLDPVIALSLGCSSVTLFDMVTAFSTFASGGIRHAPIMIRKIENNQGRILYESPEFGEQVISPQSNYIMISLMKSVLNAGTGIKARYMGFTLPAAGKTGTTDDYTDASFIGFTPFLTCGVWVGYDMPKRIGKYATASEVALPIWTKFMKAATKNHPPEEFKIPQGLVWKTVCKKCGKLASPFTEDTREEVFIKGTEPQDRCTCF